MQKLNNDKNARVFSLNRRYNELDGNAKDALNHAFMLNFKANAAKEQISVAAVVKEFYGKDTDTK
jgi:predicted DNA-binding ribbon-helix-helix protein